MEQRRPCLRPAQNQAGNLIRSRNAKCGVSSEPAQRAGSSFRTPRSAFRTEMVRLQKFLADAGVASRRAGEQIILAGRVEVNGHVVQVHGTKIDPTRDRVTVDGV